MLLRLPPETAHDIGIKGLQLGLGPSDRREQSPVLTVERFGLKFANPLGVAAGFDKNGVVVDQLAASGFGFVEVGTVTFQPQLGNPKPRLFRLRQDKALVNRLGFNNDGAAVVAERLAKGQHRCVVGVNIGKNKEVPNEDAVENYLAAFELVYPVADYIAVNVSSPNTPGLRDLQEADQLGTLLSALQQYDRVLRSDKPREGVVQDHPKPLLVKIAPDLSTDEILSIVDICLQNKIAGIIATNTTVSRAGLRTSDVEKLGSGGVSGAPLRTRSNEVISMIYRHSKGNLPVIGVGGVFTGEDAFDKIASGASLVQAYTGFIYGGPAFPSEITVGLAQLLEAKGFNSLKDAVGSATSI